MSPTSGEPVPSETRDPGVQPERTRLSWRRTTLSFALVVVLTARKVVIFGGGSGAAVVAVAMGALVWVGFLGLAHRRITALAPGRPLPPAKATILGAAGAVVTAALLGAVLVATLE